MEKDKTNERSSHQMVSPRPRATLEEPEVRCQPVMSNRPGNNAAGILFFRGAWSVKWSVTYPGGVDDILACDVLRRTFGGR